MKDFLLSPIALTEIEILVENCLRRVLTENSHSTSLTEIIDRKELCKRLDVTEPTIIRWEKKGRIPRFHIGSAVRYNWTNVIESLEKKGVRL
jgi:hypothetical protein